MHLKYQRLLLTEYANQRLFYIHSPKMSFIEYLSSIGGSVTLWVSISVYSTLTNILKSCGVLNAKVSYEKLRKSLFKKKFVNKNNVSIICIAIIAIFCFVIMAKQFVELITKSYKYETATRIVNSKSKTLKIMPENEIIQGVELDNNATDVEITASGYGRALVRVFWEYNVKEADGQFDVTSRKVPVNDGNIIIDVCTT